MQYLLLIQGDAASPIPAGEWSAFFERATASGFFRGGSELAGRERIGASSLLYRTDYRLYAL